MKTRLSAFLSIILLLASCDPVSPGRELTPDPGAVNSAATNSRSAAEEGEKPDFPQQPPAGDIRALAEEVAGLRGSIADLDRSISDLKTAVSLVKAQTSSGGTPGVFAFALLPLHEKIARCRRCVEWKIDKTRYERRRMTKDPETSSAEGLEAIDETIKEALDALGKLSTLRDDFDLLEWIDDFGYNYIYVDKEIVDWKDK